ncbi:MAG: hypothetical protein Q4E88_01420 [Coriobacteriia bacterium]|nr:hypothetical protein [Coriobacteriia bacterium]
MSSVFHNKKHLVFIGIFVAVLFLVISLVFKTNTTVESENNNESQTTSVVQSTSLPQSANEINNAVPSKETVSNLSNYINKTIELKNNEPIKANSASLNKFFKLGDIDKIYASIYKNCLYLTVEDPGDECEFKCEIKDSDTGVPAYCKDYASKIESVFVDSAVENFHPISTSQWFGSYYDDGHSTYPNSRIKNIHGLRYISMDRVKDSSFMFSGTTSLNKLEDEDLEYMKYNLNVSSLQNACSMFIGSALNNNALNMYLSKMNNTNVEKLQYVFTHCKNLTSLNDETINFPKAQNASAMFARSNLESFKDNIVFGNTIYATTSFFFECENIKTADVSSMLKNGMSYFEQKDTPLNIQKVSSTVAMFQSCSYLEDIDFGEWQVTEGSAHITHASNMFKDCQSLNNIATRYDANWEKIIKESTGIFEGCVSLVGQNRTIFNTNAIHIGYAHFDYGKSNPGYFSTSKKSEAPVSDAIVNFSFNSSYIEKITDESGQNEYAKNINIPVEKDKDFKFKVIVKDDAVPRAYDGKNEIPIKDSVFVIEDISGYHSVLADLQTALKIDFDLDENINKVTDIDGHQIDRTVNVTKGQDFQFKLVCNKENPSVVKEVFVDDVLIYVDYFNCYTIKNINKHVKVKITSQASSPLNIKHEGNAYFYFPVFDKMSFDSIKFYDKEGNTIWPADKVHRNYVMSDLVNVHSFIGRNYKFQAIRLEKKAWDGAFERNEKRAIKYIGSLLEGDYCTSLNFDKENNRPLISNIYIGDILKAYKLDNYEFWGPDIFNDSEAYIYSLDYTKESGRWDVLPMASTNNIVIQREFSDYYNLKFEFDTGVNKIIDENNNDITNGTTYSKDQPFKFKIKCNEDRGTNNVEQIIVTIDGQKHEGSSLQLDNNSLMYTVNNIEYFDATECVIKINTIFVNSFKTDKGLYHPVFDTEGFPYKKFYDDNGQCLTPSKRYPGEDFDSYIMNDVTYATKYKIDDQTKDNITTIRSIATPLKWEDTFDREDIEEGNIEKLQEQFKKEKIATDDTVQFFKKDMYPYIGSISFIRIYEAYKNAGFGVKKDDDTLFRFWTNNIFGPDEGVFYGFYFDNYDSKSQGYSVNKIAINEDISDGCCLVVTKQFDKTNPSCTVDFNKDDGVKKITDKDGKEITEKISVEKGEDFFFQVEYQDGYVEKSVCDSAVPLQYNQDKYYKISNIDSARNININTSKAQSLKSSEDSKHADMVYKPVFDKMSSNDILFYDKDGYVIKPSQRQDGVYTMSDLSDAVQFVTKNGISFQGVLLTQHSWITAFGDFIGKATKYIAGDLDIGDKCVSLDYSPDKGEPNVSNIGLTQIRNTYFKDKTKFLGNKSTSYDANCYQINDEQAKWEDISKTTEGSCVIVKDFSNTYSVSFNKDYATDKYLDDEGHEIPENLIVPFGTDLHFKVIPKEGYKCIGVKINDNMITEDNDGYLTINNVTTNLFINPVVKMPQSLYVNKIFYYPVSNGLSFKDVHFYDNNGSLLYPSGENRTYLMSDTLKAIQYVCNNPDFSFTAVRSVYEYWDTVFDKNIDINQDANDNYKHNLPLGDSVFIFNKNQKQQTEPQISNVGLNDIYNAYKEIGFCFTGHIWSNWKTSVGGEGAQFWDCEKNKMDVGYITSDKNDVIITRQFNSQITNKTIKFSKTSEIKNFTDIDGNVLPETMYLGKETQYTFRVQLNDGYGIDNILVNNNVIKPDEYNNYTIDLTSLNTFEVKVNTVNVLSLNCGGLLYRPVFQNELSEESVIFYDIAGNRCKSHGENNSYIMSDLKDAARYRPLDDIQFKAIAYSKESWKNAFGEDTSKKAIRYSKQLEFETRCQSINYEKDSIPGIKDLDGTNISLSLIQESYDDTALKRIWSCDVGDRGNVFSYEKDASGNWVWQQKDINSECCVIFDRVFNDGSYYEVDFNQVNQVDTINDFYGYQLNDYLNIRISKGGDFQFRINCMPGYVSNYVLVDNVKLEIDDNMVYTLSNVTENHEIIPATYSTKSLRYKNNLYHPVSCDLQFDKIQFYDDKGKYLRPTGMSGYKYVMSDLRDATQFVSNDYCFDAVRVDDCTWDEAFGETNEGKASKYLKQMHTGEKCSTLEFERDKQPSVFGVLLQDIQTAYFNESPYFWGPTANNKYQASRYFIDNNPSESKWEDYIDRSLKAKILISKSFGNKYNVTFSPDSGVKEILDETGTPVDSKTLVPGQDFKFKIKFNKDFIIDKVTEGNSALPYSLDRYYNINNIQSNMEIKVSSRKPEHSLEIAGHKYLPIIDKIPQGYVQFFDDTGNFIQPADGSGAYFIEDLGTAYYYCGSMNLNLIRTVDNLVWKDLYDENSIEEGECNDINPDFKKNYVDKYDNVYMLSYNKEKNPPSIYGVPFRRIVESYGTSFGGTEQRFFTKNLDKDDPYYWNAKKEEFAKSDGVDDSKTKSSAIICRQSCQVAVDFTYDSNIQFIRGKNGYIMSSHDFVQAGQDFMFKPDPNIEYLVESVKVNETLIIPEKDGYYHYYVPDENSESIKVSVNSIKGKMLNDGVYSYKPVFDSLSFADIKFFDVNKSLIIPDNNTYQMKDTKNAHYYYFSTENDVSFNAIRVVHESWKKAFGDIDKSKATEYIGKKDNDETCANLDFNTDEAPKIEGITLDKISDIYFDKYFAVWGPGIDLSSHFSDLYLVGPLNDNGFWKTNNYDQDNKDKYKCNTVIKKVFYNNFTIKMQKEDDSIADFVDQDQKSYPEKFTVKRYSNIRFKVIPQSDYVVSEVKVDDKLLLPNEDGFYELNNITEDKIINAKGKKPKSLIVKDIRYYPVIDNISIKDLQFYDDNHQLINPNSTTLLYSMENLRNAVYYTGNKGFTAIRTINQIKWTDVFDESISLNTDAKQEFKDKLPPGDCVFIFSTERIAYEPKVESIGLSKIFNNYHKVGFCSSDNGNIWSNWTMGYSEAHRWTCKESKMTEVSRDNTDTDIAILRHFD